jgi:hypothetical protein
MGLDSIKVFLRVSTVLTHSCHITCDEAEYDIRNFDTPNSNRSAYSSIWKLTKVSVSEPSGWRKASLQTGSAEENHRQVGLLVSNPAIGASYVYGLKPTVLS